MVRNKYLVFAAFLLVALLFVLPLFMKDYEIPMGSKEKEEPKYNLEKVSLVGSKDGEKQWVLHVNSAIDQGRTKTILNGLEDGQLYKDGEPKYQLTADTGEYNRRTEDFKLVSNVKLVSKDGEKIVTDELYYNNNKKEMVGDRVYVKNENGSLRAQKMVVDVDADIYEFLGAVQMELSIDDESQEEDGGARDEE